jgi:rare lipoprotein A
MGAMLRRWGRPARTAALVALAGASLAACATAGGPSRVSTISPAPRPNAPQTSRPSARGTMRPYQVNGVWYTPRDQPGYDEVGLASWYGSAFHNRQTADGELFDMDIASGAHKTLPLPSLAEVTNLENGRTIRVRLNDRGPFVQGRIIDLSRQAAKDLGFYDKGVARVRVRYIGPVDLATPQAGVGIAAAEPLAHPAPPPQPRPAAYRIQAGAFADRANAERAAERLGGEGRTSIEPLPRGETTLYRVIVDCAGEDAAAVRDRIAAAGFPDARVLGPL